VFLDLDKAFERAHRLPTLESLILNGVKGRLLSWIRQYLTDGTLKVTLQNEISDTQNLTTGMSQGGVLPPTLFNSIVMLLILKSKVPGCNTIAYADDLAIVSSSSQPYKKIQKALDSISIAAKELGFFFSTSKTTIMLFNKRRNTPQPVFHLDGKHIEISKQVKYLGIIIDSKLNFAAHAKYIRSKITANFNLLKIISNLKLGLSTNMLLTLYKALIQSIITYGAPALILASQSAIHSLEIIQRMALRFVLGLPRSSPAALIHEEANIPPFRILVRTITAKYLLRSGTIPTPTPAITKV
jgi:hypothetical protein